MKFYDFYNLTLKQANTIKAMEDAQMTWRRIAGDCAEIWPYKDISPGNQIDGKELCAEANYIIDNNFI